MSDDGVALNVPVAIVGGGPVGLVLALLLAQRGVRSLVLNTEATTRWHPKGSTHNSRTMEHYRRLGIAARIRMLGLPADQPTDVAYYTRFNGYELHRIRMPSERDKQEAVRCANLTDQVPEPIHRANQMYVEQFLLEHARTLPEIDLRFGWRCTSFADRGDHVRLAAEEVASGRTLGARAQYLVGADGGGSFVRRTLGMRFEGEEALKQAFIGGRTVSTYARSPALRNIIAPAWQHWAINPEVRLAMVELNGTDEFLIWTNLAAGASEPADEDVRTSFHAAVGVPVPVELIAHHAWTAGLALVAEGYGSGRVLLTGDAVHLFTPTGGFGMNTGIDDIANLSWKLAAAVQGWGGAQLLPSYEAERKPIAHRNTLAARALARNVGALPVSPHLEEPSTAGAAARAALGALLVPFREEFASLGVQLGARYDGSPIVCPDGTSPPVDDPVNYVPSATPGGRAPHVWLAPGVSLWDRVGPGFTLLRLGPRAPDGARFAAAARERGIPLEVLDVPHAAACELYQAELALLRPDQHVAWRGSREPEGAGEILERATGHAQD